VGDPGVGPLSLCPRSKRAGPLRVSIGRMSSALAEGRTLTLWDASALVRLVLGVDGWCVNKCYRVL
jgi:hypothetical protein